MADAPAKPRDTRLPEKEAKTPDAITLAALKLLEEKKAVPEPPVQSGKIDFARGTVTRSETDSRASPPQDGADTRGRAKPKVETENTKDGKITREDGLIRSVERGKTHIDFEYKKSEDGTVKRDGKGNPIVSKVTFSEDGKTKTVDLEELARNGDNVGRVLFQTQLGANGVERLKLNSFSVEQTGANAGKLSVLTQDGDKAIYGLVTKPDGNVSACIERLEKKGGLVRDFEHTDAADPLKVTAFTDRYKTSYNKNIEERNERLGDSKNFIMRDQDGNISYARDLHIDAAGGVVYRQDSIRTRFLEAFFGPSWLNKGDLTAAKEHLLDVAGKHYPGGRLALQQALNQGERRFHNLNKTRKLQVSDDQIAKVYRSLASIFDKGHCGSISDKEAKTGFARAIASWRDPLEWNRQGQIGSCFLNTILMNAELSHPDMVYGAFASAYTTGKFKGKTFNHYDLTAVAGQDSFNHTMTSFLGKTFGFKHMTPGFRGTTFREASIALKALTGQQLLTANNMSHARIGRLLRDGTKALWFSTMGGAHAQACVPKAIEDKDGKVRLVAVKANTWYHNDDKKLFEC